uniref:NTR domain-containing protein n=1 Tax=Ascaris lumbricoides TaxID=6252 RepID=A0A0M3ISN3_ASCLU
GTETNVFAEKSSHYSIYITYIHEEETAETGKGTTDSPSYWIVACWSVPGTEKNVFAEKAFHYSIYTTNIHEKETAETGKAGRSVVLERNVIVKLANRWRIWEPEAGAEQIPTVERWPTGRSVVLERNVIVKLANRWRIWEPEAGAEQIPTFGFHRELRALQELFHISRNRRLAAGRSVILEGNIIVKLGNSWRSWEPEAGAEQIPTTVERCPSCDRFGAECGAVSCENFFAASSDYTRFRKSVMGFKMNLMYYFHQKSLPRLRTFMRSDQRFLQASAM